MARRRRDDRTDDAAGMADSAEEGQMIHRIARRTGDTAASLMHGRRRA